MMPLSVYLLTFILCFVSDRWYRRKIFLPLQVAAIGGLGYTILQPTGDLDLRLLLAVIATCLFCLCMYCHGELAARRPAGDGPRMA